MEVVIELLVAVEDELWDSSWNFNSGCCCGGVWSDVNGGGCSSSTAISPLHSVIEQRKTRNCPLAIRKANEAEMSEDLKRKGDDS